MKKILLIIIIAVTALFGGICFIMAPAIKAMAKTDILNTDNNLKIFTGGGNSAVCISPDRGSIIIVDTKMGKAAKVLKAYCDSINPNAAITIINTHEHADHVAGNKLYPNAAVITGEYENSGPNTVKGTLVKAGQTYTIKTADDVIEIRNMGAAHSFADTIVYFRKRKLLLTGDLVFNNWHPVLIKAGGTDTGRWITTLLYVATNHEIKTVVPGHGDISDSAILKTQEEYFTGIKAALGDAQKLKTLKEKYRSYYYIPFITGFDQSAGFLKRNY